MRELQKLEQVDFNTTTLYYSINLTFTANMLTRILFYAGSLL